MLNDDAIMEFLKELLMKKLVKTVSFKSVSGPTTIKRSNVYQLKIQSKKLFQMKILLSKIFQSTISRFWN